MAVQLAGQRNALWTAGLGSVRLLLVRVKPSWEEPDAPQESPSILLIYQLLLSWLLFWSPVLLYLLALWARR